MAPVPAAAFIDRVTEHLKRGLEERLSSLGGREQSLEEAERLAERMLDAVPMTSRWDDRLGPFYSTGKLARLWGGVSRQAVADRRERRTVLGLKTADGALVYPTFQFDERNRVLAGLPEVLQCFRGVPVDGWTLASWLVAPLRSLERSSVIDWLRAGRELEPVLTLARDAARRYSQ
jgi:hypothetical protein